MSKPSDVDVMELIWDERAREIKVRFHLANKEIRLTVADARSFAHAILAYLPAEGAA